MAGGVGAGERASVLSLLGGGVPAGVALAVGGGPGVLEGLGRACMDAGFAPTGTRASAMPVHPTGLASCWVGAGLVDFGSWLGGRRAVSGPTHFGSWLGGRCAATGPTDVGSWLGARRGASGVLDLGSWLGGRAEPSGAAGFGSWLGGRPGPSGLTDFGSWLGGRAGLLAQQALVLGLREGVRLLAQQTLVLGLAEGVRLLAQRTWVLGSAEIWCCGLGFLAWRKAWGFCSSGLGFLAWRKAWGLVCAGALLTSLGWHWASFTCRINQIAKKKQYTGYDRQGAGAFSRLKPSSTRVCVSTIPSPRRALSSRMYWNSPCPSSEVTKV